MPPHNGPETSHFNPQRSGIEKVARGEDERGIETRERCSVGIDEEMVFLKEGESGLADSSI